MERVSTQKTLITLGLFCAILILFPCDNCYSTEVFIGKIGTSGFIVLIVSLYYSFKYKESEKIVFDIANQPLLETDEATSGVSFSGEGILEADELLESKYTKTKCVYYHAIKKEYIRSSFRLTRTKTIENIVKYVPFYVKDKRGRLRIDLENVDSDFSGEKVKITNNNIENFKHSEVGCVDVRKVSALSQSWSILNLFLRKNSYVESECVLKPGGKIFVHGYVKEKNGELVLCEHNGFPLIVSRKSHKGFLREFNNGDSFVILSHFLSMGGYSAFLFSLNHFLKADLKFIFFLFIFGNLILGGSVVFTIYNRVIRLKNRVLNARSNIDGELKRRDMYIDNLLQVVKEYTIYENEIQSIVAKIRNKNISTDLVYLSEKYQDLKAADNYQNLIVSITDTEERIAYSRNFYNNTVSSYNSFISQFPASIIATIYKAKKFKFF